MTSEADQRAGTAESRPIGRAIAWIDYRLPITQRSPARDRRISLRKSRRNRAGHWPHKSPA
jgi:hypothetical protein